jgi:Na+-translocating ferredoxin:NAD+ oxidoreductase subunit B
VSSSMTKENLVDTIDSLLPQTQCGLCGYEACRPYAKAISTQNETIDRCLPGGTRTLLALAGLLNQDPRPYLDDIISKTKPPSKAIIRESECIGCTKCIQACPVDAIVGSAKRMHTVIETECTGCELCVKPCPVDCIDMVAIEKPSENLQQGKSALARKRYEARQHRLLTTAKSSMLQKTATQKKSLDSRKQTIEAAIIRVNAKKGTQHEC